ncbi:MAG: N-acetylglucosamine-6-phosphate deacetylase [Woeseiaceae bacterium]
MTIALGNGRVFTGTMTIEGVAVLIDGDEIADLLPEDQLTADMETVDLGGGLLIPGFIDLQVNGGGGLLFSETPTIAAIDAIGASHRAFGTTSFLPTVISSSLATMKNARDAVVEAVHEPGSGVIGIHFEGPCLNPRRKGVHDEKLLSSPTEKLIDIVLGQEVAPTLMTVAPEMTSAKTIRRLVASGVTVAIGHSDASYEQTRAALDAGATGFTHLFNAMSPLRSRDPGVVGAALDDVSSFCGVIADGHHAHWASLRIAISAKPTGKVFLVTDAMSAVGTDAKEFQLYGENVRIENGRCETSAGVLAGSNLNMAQAVRNATGHLGVTVEEAIRMATTYPARFAGIDSLYGSIERGKKANLVLVDDGLRVLRVWERGRPFVPSGL